MLNQASDPPSWVFFLQLEELAITAEDTLGSWSVGLDVIPEVRQFCKGPAVPAPFYCLIVQLICNVRF